MICKRPGSSAAALIVGALLPTLTVHAADVAVSIQPVSCTPGEQTVAWISVDHAAGITGADASLSLPNFAVPGPAHQTDATSGFLIASRPRPGHIDFAIASPTGLAVDQALLLGVPITLERTTEPGTYALTFEYLQFYNNLALPTSSQPISGTLTVLPLPTDLDGDGLPDEWETQFYGNTNTDGQEDFDRDGVSDAAEFIAGTDAARADSALAIDQMTVEYQANTVTLHWTAQANRSYVIEWSDDPLAPDMTWHTVYRPTIEADVNGAHWIDDGSRTYELPSTPLQRFYRIRVAQP